jgi:beta-galactosidase
LGAGFPPFFPPISEGDSAFTAMTALAYGLRGFNIYMAVERDRWIGAPIDRHGRRRPFADFWERLVGALERLDFFGLQVRSAVHVVVPRNLRRLARVLHAFGPVTLAAFHVSGGGAEEACFEDEFGMGSPVLIEAWQFVKRLETALSAERIPYAVVAGDLTEQALQHGKWTVVASAGGLEQEIRETLTRAAAEGRAISIGPHPVERDAIFQPLPEPFVLSPTSLVPSLLSLDDAALREAVRTAKSALELPSVGCSAEGISVTVHQDHAGQPRVAFVINPTTRALRAELSLEGVARMVDALDGSEFRAKQGQFELPLPPQTVRLFELFPLLFSA